MMDNKKVNSGVEWSEFTTQQKCNDYYAMNSLKVKALPVDLNMTY